MDATFKEHVEALPAKFKRLVSMTPVTCTTLPGGMPKRGIYLFSENGNDLYVGRSNAMRSRVRNHGSPSASHGTAAFAFKLAREATGNPKATYRTEGSRAQLIADPNFLKAFSEAKARIAQMQVRFIEETDPVRQCLLEVYVALALGTPYNDFDNH